MDRSSGQISAQSSVIIRTVHDYTSEGRDKIINTYRYAAAVDCTFDPLLQTFRLKGEAKWIDLAFLQFMEILGDNIRRETRSREPSRLFHRNVFTELNAPPVPWLDDPKLHGGRQLPVHLAHVKFPSRGSNREVALFDTDSSIFPIVHYWTPKVSQEDFTRLLDLSHRPSKADLLSVEGKCEVVPDWVKCRVRVAAYEEDVVKDLIRKLEKIERIFKSGFKPHENFLVHVENVTKFQFRLVPLSKQGDRAQRTLFELDSKWIDHPIERLYTVRLLEYKPVPQKYMNYKVDSREIPEHYGPEPRDWSGYLFVRRKPLSTPGVSDNGPSQALTLATKADPFRDIDPEDLVTQFYSGTSTRTTTDIDIHGLTASTPQIGPAPTRQTITTRQPKSRIPSSDQDETYTSPNESETTGHSNLGYSSKMTEDEATSDSGAGYHLPSFLDFGSRPSTTGDEEEQDPGITTRKPKERRRARAIADESGTDSRPASQAARIQNSPFGSTSRQGSETSDMTIEDPGKDFSKPSDDFGLNFGARPGDDIPTTTEVRTSRKPKAQRQKHVVKEEDVVENLSGLSLGEPSTRKIMNTMRQKAPSKALNAIQKDADKLRRTNMLTIKNDFSKALEYVRCWRGSVMLQAKLGRLLFIDLGRDATRISIEYDEWDVFAREEVKNPHNVSTHFTSVLTRDHNDIEYILGLGAAGGTESLFNATLPLKTVTYEFHCVEAGQPCTMIIDAHTFNATVYSETRSFGTTYVANAMHTWDSCIELSGRTVLPMTEALQTIVQSLEALGDDTPAITFFIPAQGLVINKVLCKREARYPFEAQSVIKGNSMHLVVTEVQHLRLGQRKADGNTQCRAMGRHRDGMKEAGRLWYTVSIAPTNAENLFQENQSLGVGEETNWSSEAFIEQGKRSILYCLATATNVVLSKIDDVGYGNIRFER